MHTMLMIIMWGGRGRWCGQPTTHNLSVLMQTQIITHVDEWMTYMRCNLMS